MLYKNIFKEDNRWLDWNTCHKIDDILEKDQLS